MKSVLALFFVLITCNCVAQTKIARVDSLSINFEPAFIYSSKLSIIRHSTFSIIQLIVNNSKTSKPYTKVAVNISNKFTDTLWTFLRTYQFRMKNNSDTIISKELNKKGDSVEVYHVTSGLDGITVNGEFKNESIHKFSFWSPKKETQNHQLMLRIFDLINTIIKDEKSVYYVERLSQYFNFGLGLKQLSSKPIKYKLYGLVSTNEKSALRQFFERLPQKPNVFIDVSNLTIAMVADTVIKDGVDLHKNIFWTAPNDQVLEGFYRIGVPQNRIICDKKVVRIDSATQKPVFVKQRLLVVK